jgi:CDP-diacylglycerol--glycerol-3-phosphate 3-phosphatidyltransferase
MILNLPNALALLRVALVTLMFALLVHRDASIFAGIHYSWLDFFAAVLFVTASITDFFDGYIARSWNQVTKLGAILDPLADKMMILAAFLGLLMIDRANVWAIYIILTREFFITGLRVLMASEGISVSASIWGKMKTFVQIFAVGFLLMEWPFGEALLWLAVIVSLYSGYEYIKVYVKK